MMKNRLQNFRQSAQPCGDMFHEHKDEHGSPWEAMQSIASKIGCSGETLRSWVRQDEGDKGLGAGMTSADRERLKELERENRD